MDENLNVKTVEETADTEETADFEAKYNEALKEAEKYKGYFKKEKAKQKNAKADPQQDIDLESLETKIMQKVEFYTTNPAAKELKAEIDTYMETWLSIEQAFKLAAAEKDPSLLIDQQTKAKQEAPNKVLTGVANPEAWGIDFASMTDEEAMKLPMDKQNEYWEYKKRA